MRTVPAMKMLLGYAVLQRISAIGGHHPMSGGGRRTRLDGVADYADLRRSTYGYDLVPLPRSLALSAADEALNRTVKLHA